LPLLHFNAGILFYAIYSMHVQVAPR